MRKWNPGYEEMLAPALSQGLNLGKLVAESSGLGMGATPERVGHPTFRFQPKRLDNLGMKGLCSLAPPPSGPDAARVRDSQRWASSIPWACRCKGCDKDILGLKQAAVGGTEDGGQTVCSELDRQSCTFCPILPCLRLLLSLLSDWAF